MMILAEGKKGGAVDPVLQLHAKDVTVESDRSLEVGYLQVHVADIGNGHVLSFHCTKTLQPKLNARSVHAQIVTGRSGSRRTEKGPVAVGRI